MTKVIVTAAITGSIHTPSMSPYLPITPQQIADEAVRSWEAGASVVHLHVRNPETGQPSSSIELFREVAERIKKRSDVVVGFTTGGGIGMTPAERAAVVSALRPELASLNTGSLNFCFSGAAEIAQFQYDWEKPFIQGTEDYIFPNTFKTLAEFCQIMNKAGTKPELEVYDVGMLNNIVYMIRKGVLAKPVHIQFVLGILGGIPARVEHLVYLLQVAKREIGDFTWSTCSAGKNQMNICTTALALGGNVRVGLEDALFIRRGELATSNAEQVKKIIRIAGELGCEVASPAEVRVELGLKGLDQVGF